MEFAKELLDARDAVIEQRLARRNLIKGLVAGGVALAGGGLLAGCSGSGSGLDTGSGVSDADVLNFALNLEYLEAEYYLRGVYGRGLDTSAIGSSPGSVTGGRMVTFATPALHDLMAEVAIDEEDHVRFLRSALGSAAVPRPAINLSTAFDAAANAAGIGASFDPFANETNFFIGAFIFEDVGVTAYKGAAPLINNRNTLEAAAGILGVEAYHAGMVRTTLYNMGGAAIDATTKISDLRDSVDGPTDDDQPVVLGGKANIVPTDSNGIAYSRSTSQVLKIVYLGGSSSGGFFPNGLNGNIRTA